MSTIIAVLLVLFGNRDLDRCLAGQAIIAYEDMSYTISQDDSTAICDLYVSSTTITYTKVKINSGSYFTVSHITILAELDFPESIVRDYIGSGTIIDYAQEAQ